MSGSDDDIISVGKPIPKIASCEPLDGRRARISWRGGESFVVDLRPALSVHKSFVDVLRDDALFQSGQVSDFGDCVEWADAALAATWIEELAERQHALPAEQ